MKKKGFGRKILDSRLGVDTGSLCDLKTSKRTSYALVSSSEVGRIEVSLSGLCGEGSWNPALSIQSLFYKY